MKGVFNKIITEPLRDFFQRLVDFMPNLLSSLIILALGIAVGWIIKKALTKLLQLLNIDRFCHRVGITEALQKGGVKDTPSNLIGRVFFWLVLINFIIMALYALRIPAVENLLQQFFLYLPNIFVAAFLITIGYILSNFFARAVLIASVNAGIKFSRLLSKTVKTGIIVLTITMALEQLGIGKDTVIIAFSLIFGGMVFALALAFGLAGKDIAKEYLEKTLKGKPEEEEDELKHL
jgi:hypothetical protein